MLSRHTNLKAGHVFLTKDDFITAVTEGNERFYDQGTYVDKF